MHGNVCELCQDRYAEDYYESSPTDDPTGPATGISQVIRGGGSRSSARYCRAACRVGTGYSDWDTNWGFRVAAVPSGKSGE